jgi:hypothetical protein
MTMQSGVWLPIVTPSTGISPRLTLPPNSTAPWSNSAEPVHSAKLERAATAHTPSRRVTIHSER